MGALALVASGVGAVAGIGVTTAVVGKLTAVGVATGAGVVCAAGAGAASISLHKSAAKAEKAAEELGVVRAELTSVKEKLEGLRKDMDQVRELVVSGKTHARVNMNNENVYDETIKTEIDGCLDKICDRLDGLKGRARSLMVEAETIVFEEAACFKYGTRVKKQTNDGWCSIL